MKVFITGIAGVLGSNLAKMLVTKGYNVEGCDILRRDEAWRLQPILNEIKYHWKSTLDLFSELDRMDIVFDCGIGTADRPFGNQSPIQTTLGNIMPPQSLLDKISRMSRKPTIIYPSSFNSLYGHVGGIYSEDTSQYPTSIYGWTKASVEQLYTAYRIMYGLPIILTRVGSAYGEGMRSDELIAKLIIHSLLEKRRFNLRSPRAKRLWTYSADVLTFYERLLENLDQCIGATLHCAGNVNDEVVENIEIAKKITSSTGTSMEVFEDEYEPGEIVYGEPINFSINSTKTRELIGWSPRFSLDEGIKRTINWFKSNLHHYS
jgi:nucleoside-diphosphate-sugar epimerase